MSRNDNMVRIIGKVVRGPIVKYTDSGKCRCFYQVEITPRNKDNGMIQVPFIRSVGNQAEKDRDNIKIGNLISVEGRIITRTEKKTIYQVKDPENPQNLIPINPDDEENSYNDDEIFTTVVERPVTEIYAEDVMYVQNWFDHLPLEEKVKMFNEDVLKRVLKEFIENGGTFDEVKNLQRN